MNAVSKKYISFIQLRKTLSAIGLVCTYSSYKSHSFINIKRMVHTTTKADSDMSFSEDMMPEFEVDLSEKPTYIQNKYDFKLSSRDQHISKMADSKETYDILVIGGGCNGAGVALDAASRGLKVALIDKNDFGSGTSSKSTKLAHGGVRYLEQMVMMQGDVKMSYHLLKEALVERNYFLDCNPFLNHEIKMVIPDTSFLRTLFWNFPGTIVYHLMYLMTSLKHEFYSSIKGPRMVLPRTLRKLFPTMTHLGGNYGTLLHEGQFNDTRQCIMSILTSTIEEYDQGMKGANIANYVSFDEFIKDQQGKIIGAKVKDELNGKEFEIKSKAVVNCTGVFADKIRIKDDPDAKMRM